jgi:hypothetical protein
MSETLSSNTNRINKIEQEFEMLRKGQDKILLIVTELKMGVCGSEKVGVEGIVQKQIKTDAYIYELKEHDIINTVEKHSDYIDKDKKWKYILYGGWIVALAIVTSIIQLWDKIFK